MLLNIILNVWLYLLFVLYNLGYVIRSIILYECIILECIGKNYYKYVYVTIYYMVI